MLWDAHCRCGHDEGQTVMRRARFTSQYGSRSEAVPAYDVECCQKQSWHQDGTSPASNAIASAFAGKCCICIVGSLWAVVLPACSLHPQAGPHVLVHWLAKPSCKSVTQHWATAGAVTCLAAFSTTLRLSRSSVSSSTTSSTLWTPQTGRTASSGACVPPLTCPEQATWLPCRDRRWAACILHEVSVRAASFLGLTHNAHGESYPAEDRCTPSSPRVSYADLRHLRSAVLLLLLR